jgi:hypothetical protein
MEIPKPTPLEKLANDLEYEGETRSNAARTSASMGWTCVMVGRY